MASTPTLLHLGAARFQYPALQAARARGCRLVTCDRDASAPGHSLADRAVTLDTTDVAGVEALAREEKVDGVLSFGSDPGACTAASVAQTLGLPGHPLEGVEVLSDKARFRAFLAAQELQSLTHGCFTATERNELRAFVREHGAPMVLKPVDGNGSKGVAVLRDTSYSEALVDRALANSRRGALIVERFVEKRGNQVCGDGFVQNGELVFVDWGDGYFPEGEAFMAPCAERFPSDHTQTALKRLRDLVATVVRRVGLTTGPINIDAFVTPDGSPFLVELGARSGGNYLPSAIHLHRGVDMVDAALGAALDPHYRLPPPEAPKFECVGSYMIHSRQAGTLERVRLADELTSCVLQDTRYLAPGQPVQPFHSASAAIGNLLLGFPSRDQMADTMERLDRLVEVTVNVEPAS